MLPKLGDYVEEHAQDVLEEEIGEGKLTQHAKDIFVSGTVIRTELGHGSLKHLVVARRSYYLVTVNEWKHGAITVDSLISFNHTPQSG